jgi:hypothetical protein
VVAARPDSPAGQALSEIARVVAQSVGVPQARTIPLTAG